MNKQQEKQEAKAKAMKGRQAQQKAKRSELFMGKQTVNKLTRNLWTEERRNQGERERDTVTDTYPAVPGTHRRGAHQKVYRNFQ